MEQAKCYKELVVVVIKNDRILLKIFFQTVLLPYPNSLQQSFNTDLNFELLDLIWSGISRLNHLFLRVYIHKHQESQFITYVKECVQPAAPVLGIVAQNWN